MKRKTRCCVFNTFNLTMIGTQKSTWKINGTHYRANNQASICGISTTLLVSPVTPVTPRFSPTCPLYYYVLHVLTSAVEDTYVVYANNPNGTRAIIDYRCLAMRAWTRPTNWGNAECRDQFRAIRETFAAALYDRAYVAATKWGLLDVLKRKIAHPKAHPESDNLSCARRRSSQRPANLNKSLSFSLTEG